MRIAASIEYDGQSFCGWQRQPDVRNVQSLIELALSSITQSKILISAAGRTDSGVHALGQIIHFDTNVISKNSKERTKKRKKRIILLVKKQKGRTEMLLVKR